MLLFVFVFVFARLFAFKLTFTFVFVFLRLSLRLRLCLCLFVSAQTLKNTNTIGDANTQATHKTRQVAFFVLGTSQRKIRVKRINARSKTRFL